MNPSETQAVKTMEELMQRAIVVEIIGHRVGEHRGIDPEDLEITTNARAEFAAATITQDQKKRDLSLGKKIFDCGELRAIKTLDRSFSDMMRRRALSSPLKAGHYLIAKASFETIDEAITEYRREREKLKQIFKSKLTQVIAADRARLGSLFRHDDYPDTEELDRRVYLEVRYTDYSTPKGLSSINQLVYERERRRAEQECETLMADLRIALRESMSEFVSKLQAQLTSKEDGSKRRVYKNTVANLREFLEMFELKNFAGDTALQNLVDTAKKLMGGVTANDLRDDDTLRQRLGKDLTSLATQVATLTENVSTRRYALVS